MKRTIIIVAVVAVLAVAAVFLFRGKNENDEHGMVDVPAITVETITVDSTNVSDNSSASGTVRPVEESRIAPKIMSNVLNVYADVGDFVRAGQVLIRLESRDLNAQLEQARAGLSATSVAYKRSHTAIQLQQSQTSTGIASAEANLRAAKEQLSLVQSGPRKQQRAQARLAVVQADAQLRNAETELNRMKSLYNQGAVAKQLLDNAQTSYDVAKAQKDSAVEQSSLTEEGSREQEIRAAQEQVRQAEAALKLAKASVLQDAMSARNAEVAKSQIDQAKAGVKFAQTQLGYATIVSPISGVVSERLVDPGDTVSPGIPMIVVQADSRKRLEVTVSEAVIHKLRIGNTVSVSLGSENRTADGRIAVISPQGDANSHKFLVKVDLPANLNAKAGEFGRINLAVDSAKRIIIPENVIHNEGGLSSVFLLDTQNRVRMQVIKIGRTVPEGVEVVSGLNPADRIIVKNSGVLADGIQAKSGRIQ